MDTSVLGPEVAVMPVVDIVSGRVPEWLKKSLRNCVKSEVAVGSYQTELICTLGCDAIYAAPKSPKFPARILVFHVRAVGIPQAPKAQDLTDPMALHLGYLVPELQTLAVHMLGLPDVDRSHKIAVRLSPPILQSVCAWFNAGSVHISRFHAADLNKLLSSISLFVIVSSRELGTQIEESYALNCAEMLDAAESLKFCFLGGPAWRAAHGRSLAIVALFLFPVHDF